nr:hypothetical protein [Tanacetum cinerariifolium]
MRQDLTERMRMECILEFFSTCRIEDEMGLDVASTLCFQLGGARRSMTWRQFILALGLHTAEEMAEDEFSAYWYAEGRKSDGRLSEGYFIRRLAHHFGLVSDDRLRGLSVLAHELPLIDMGELVKLNICIEIGDDYAWIAQGPERQQVAAAGAPKTAEDALAVDEGA